MKTALVLALLATPLAAQEFFTLKGHGGPIMDIAVAPSGQIATASFDNSVGLWSGKSPEWLDGHRAAVICVAFAGGLGVVSAGDDFTARLWQPETGQSALIGRHEAKITDIAYHEATQTIATASWDSRIGLWTASDGPDEFRTRWLEGHRQGVNAVAFTADGTALYSASVDGTIRRWSLESGASRVLVRHGFGVNRLVLNEAEGWLAYGAVDGGTRLIDLQTGAQIADFTLDRRPILSMAHHPASHQLAVGDGEGFIMIIDTSTKQITRDFRATRRGPIWAMAFSKNGLNIHAGGIEDILYSWPVATMDTHGPMSAQTRSFLENPETLPNGERQFKRKCSICHTLTPSSARKAGPTLHGLFGRRAGTVADYAYSDILTGSDIVWSDRSINDLFEEGPDHYIPGTKMPMQRIAGQQDRDDLIAYLRQASDSTGGN